MQPWSQGHEHARMCVRAWPWLMRCAQVCACPARGMCECPRACLCLLMPIWHAMRATAPRACLFVRVKHAVCATAPCACLFVPVKHAVCATAPCACLFVPVKHAVCANAPSTRPCAIQAGTWPQSRRPRGSWPQGTRRASPSSGSANGQQARDAQACTNPHHHECFTANTSGKGGRGHTLHRTSASERACSASSAPSAARAGRATQGQGSTCA